MSEETWPVRYARLDQSFDRREWRQQYEQQWPIECDHAKQGPELTPGTQRGHERSSGGGEARDLGEGLRHVEGLQAN
jgi:hypothetical protein